MNPIPSLYFNLPGEQAYVRRKKDVDEEKNIFLYLINH
jgi:hypothetical protein